MILSKVSLETSLWILCSSGSDATLLFKNKIEETVNDVVKYVGEEAFKIYGGRKVVKSTSYKGVGL